MAELRVRSKKSFLGGILKLSSVFEKLKKTLLRGRNKSSSGDVKEGHFAVIAEDGEESKRFVVPLNCLTNSTFLRLLERSAEKYGFDRDGAVTIPCRPNELEVLLAQQRLELKEGSYFSDDKVMVQCQCYQRRRPNVYFNLKQISR